TASRGRSEVRLRALLAALRERDVRLAATPEGRLRFDAPRGAVTPALREALRARRAQVLALVRAWRLPPGPLGVLLTEAPPATPADPAADPRPDLAADSPAWTTLLRLAYARDGGQADGGFVRLRGVRSLGAHLRRRGRGWSVAPGEVGQPEWAAV